MNKAIIQLIEASVSDALQNVLQQIRVIDRSLSSQLSDLEARHSKRETNDEALMIEAKALRADVEALKESHKGIEKKLDVAIAHNQRQEGKLDSVIKENERLNGKLDEMNERNKSLDKKIDQILNSMHH